MLATTLEQAGKDARALEVFSEMAKSSRHPVVYNGLAYLALKRKDLKTALEFAQRAENLAPADPNVLDTLGWALVNNGQLALGIRHLERAAQAQPENGNILYHLATTLLRTGELDREKLALEQAAALTRDYQEHERVNLALQAL